MHPHSFLVRASATLAALTLAAGCTNAPSSTSSSPSPSPAPSTSPSTWPTTDSRSLAARFTIGCARTVIVARRLLDGARVAIDVNTPLIGWGAVGAGDRVVVHQQVWVRVPLRDLVPCKTWLKFTGPRGNERVCVARREPIMVDERLTGAGPRTLSLLSTMTVERTGERIVSGQTPDGTLVAFPERARVACSGPRKTPRSDKE